MELIAGGVVNGLAKTHGHESGNGARYTSTMIGVNGKKTTDNHARDDMDMEADVDQDQNQDADVGIFLFCFKSTTFLMSIYPVARCI